MALRRLLVTAVVITWSVTAAAQTEWVLYEGNPVMPGPEADEWPGLLRWAEAVIVVDGTYHMFLTGTSVSFTVNHEIGHATSPDGITWTMDPHNPVLSPETEGDWEVNSYLSLAVIHDGTGFRAWYGGVDSTGSCQVGLATSPDGSNWTRHPGNPVLEVGEVGSFDEALVEPGSVIRRGGLYHMWYGAARTPSIFAPRVIGYATSVDGVSWNRHPTPVLEPGSASDWDPNLYGPGVVFDGAIYHMWYTGFVGNSWSVSEVHAGYATSPDGISWTKHPENPIDVLGALVEQPRVLLNTASHQCEMYYNHPVGHEVNLNLATSSCRVYAQTRRPTGRMIPE